MQKLNLYQDPDGNELLAIIVSSEFEIRCSNDPGLKLIASQDLLGDFTTWPTDTLFSQDMNS